MTNIIAPSSESLSTYYSYDDLNIDSKALTFTIPVYNNMPTKTSHPPIGSISAHLNALKWYGGLYEKIFYFINEFINYSNFC